MGIVLLLVFALHKFLKNFLLYLYVTLHASASFYNCTGEKKNMSWGHRTLCIEKLPENKRNHQRE